MRLLVLSEKHYNRYFAVPTDRKLHQVCVQILKERLTAGWYNPGERPEELGMLPETIRALPEGRLKKEILKLQEEVKLQLRKWNSAREFQENVIQAIKQPFPKNGKAQLVRTFSLLSSRDHNEYERVELDKTEN